MQISKHNQLNIYYTATTYISLHIKPESNLKKQACGNKDLAVTDSQVLQFALHIHSALLDVDELSLLAFVCVHPAILKVHVDVHLFLDLNSV